MKTTVVPAQITTVEDRIAGNLTFIQIFLLIVPLLTSTILYLGIAPHGKVSGFKIVLITLQFMICGGLALRIKGKVVVEWLMVYLKFYTRPHIYVFTKTNRPMVDMVFPTDEVRDVSPEEESVQSTIPALTFPEHKALTHLLEHPGISIGFSLAEKGGVNVSLTKQN